MKLEGRYKIEFDVILDDNYKMPFDLVDKFFHDYSLIGVKSIIKENCGNVFKISDHNDYSHREFLRYFCDKHTIRKTPHIFPHYEILDYDNFIQEISDMKDFYIGVKGNYSAYEREFNIDNII